MNKLSHKARFTLYRDSQVIEKSKLYAHWTVPALMVDVETSHNGKQQGLERDYQEVGALLVNNLSTKLSGLLFPASRPFFKIDASADLLQKANEKGMTPSEVASGLARLEMDSCKRLFINASYAQVVQAVKHLIVTGNVLLYRDAKDCKTVAYGLQSYALQRSSTGRMLDCVLREGVAFITLPEAIRTALRTKHAAKYSADRIDKGNCTVELYTRIEYVPAAKGKSEHYLVTQEADDVPVGDAGTFPPHLCPWQAPTWTHVAGENYGRGLVEEYAGGFAKLSDVSHAQALYIIEALRVINLVAPGSGTDIDALSNAETGEYVTGTPDSVNAHETGASQKLEEARQIISELFGNLAKAFMYKGSTRDAERVTATELRMDAQEAEATLGGVYSSLAESMQVPFAHLLITEVSPESLPEIIGGGIKLNVVAGIPALGRANDIQNLLEAAQEIAAILPVFVQSDKRMDPQRIIDMILAGRSVDVEVLRKSPAQLKEEADAAAQGQAGQNQLAQAQAMAAQSEQLQQLPGQ
jgi:hypothetical protein